MLSSDITYHFFSSKIINYLMIWLSTHFWTQLGVSTDTESITVRIILKMTLLILLSSEPV